LVQNAPVNTAVDMRGLKTPALLAAKPELTR